MGTLISAFEHHQVPQEMTEPQRIRAILVDGSSEYLAVIMALLDFHELLDVVGRAATSEEAIQLAAELQPDLVLVDLNIQCAEFLIAFIAMSPELLPLKVVGMTSGRELTKRATELVVSVSALISKCNFREEFPAVLKVLFNEPKALQPAVSPQ